MIDESPLTNRFAEFHDARVLHAIKKDELLTICSDAFIRGWVGVWQRIDLTSENGSFEWFHDRGEENWTINGSLNVDDSHPRNGLPIPFEASGP